MYELGRGRQLAFNAYLVFLVSSPIERTSLLKFNREIDYRESQGQNLGAGNSHLDRSIGV